MGTKLHFFRHLKKLLYLCDNIIISQYDYKLFHQSNLIYLIPEKQCPASGFATSTGHFLFFMEHNRSIIKKK